MYNFHNNISDGLKNYHISLTFFSIENLFTLKPHTIICWMTNYRMFPTSEWLTKLWNYQVGTKHGRQTGGNIYNIFEARL